MAMYPSIFFGLLLLSTAKIDHVTGTVLDGQEMRLASECGNWKTNNQGNVKVSVFCNGKRVLGSTRFNKFDGVVSGFCPDAENPMASLQNSAITAEIESDSIDSGDETVDEHIKHHHLKSVEYPKVTWKSNNNGSDHLLGGALDFLGNTQSVELDVSDIKYNPNSKGKVKISGTSTVVVPVERNPPCSDFYVVYKFNMHLDKVEE